MEIILKHLEPKEQVNFLQIILRDVFSYNDPINSDVSRMWRVIQNIMDEVNSKYSTEEILKEFDSKFGKLKHNHDCGEEESDIKGAGCDDCYSDQVAREEHREFVRNICNRFTK